MYWYFAHNSSSLWIPCPCLPLPPPLWRPLVCFLYLWVCVCSHRRFFGLFLRFTWMMSWSVCLCLTHFTKHSILWTHLCYCKWESPFFFWLSITSLCGYTPHFLYPFICWRAFGLLPCVGYCKWCCSNIGVHVWFFFFKLVFSFFSNIFLGVELPYHMITLFLVFWGTSILFATVKAPIYISTNNTGGFPFLHIQVNNLLFVRFI